MFIVWNILYYHFGEISYTEKSPIDVYSPESDIDLSEMKSCLSSSDDYRLTSVNAYEVIPVELPENLNPLYWIDRYIRFQYLWGIKGAKELPIAWQIKLLDFSESARNACVKLLRTKKFRSDFRQSLYNQLTSWLNDDNPKYDTPFSNRQWDCLLRFEPKY